MTRTKRMPRPTPAEDEYFETFWKAYPAGKKGRKDRAKRQFMRELREGVPPETMIEGAKRYRAYVKFDEMERGEIAYRYCYHAVSFLGNQLYLDRWPVPFDPAEKIDPNDVVAVEAFRKQIGL